MANLTGAKLKARAKKVKRGIVFKTLNVLSKMSKAVPHSDVVIGSVLVSPSLPVESRAGAVGLWVEDLTKSLSHGEGVALSIPYRSSRFYGVAVIVLPETEQGKAPYATACYKPEAFGAAVPSVLASAVEAAMEARNCRIAVENGQKGDDQLPALLLFARRSMAAQDAMKLVQEAENNYSRYATLPHQTSIDGARFQVIAVIHQ